MSLPTPSLPVGNSTIHVTPSRGSAFLLPNTINFEGINSRKNIFSSSPDVRDGLIRTRESTWDSRDVTLSGVVFDGTLTFDQLSRAVAASPWVIRPAGASGRYITAEVQGYDFVKNGDNSILGVTIDLQALDPFFYDDALSTTSQQYDSAGPTGALQTITLNGDLIVRPVVKITGGVGGVTNPTVTSDATSKFLTYTGSVGNGEVLVIDCDAITATVDGANSLNSMNGSFFYNPVELLPGINDFTYSGTGVMTVEFEYRSKWLISD